MFTVTSEVSCITNADFMRATIGSLCGNSGKISLITENPDNFDHAQPEERFTSQKIQWIKNLPVQGGAADAAAAKHRAKQRKQTNNVIRTLINSLKTCLNHGNPLDSVLGFLQQMVPEPSKKRKKPKNQNHPQQ